MDPRLKKLANLLVHYSVKLKKGQLVRITGEVTTLPLLEEIYKEAIDVGAHPYITMRVPDVDEYRLKHGPQEPNHGVGLLQMNARRSHLLP